MMMKLTTIGSGTFFVNKTSSASSFLLEIANKKLLIDCGPGTLMKLSMAGYNIKDLDYIFITHFHSDHTSDLFPIFMNFRLLDNYAQEKLISFPIIYGPKGIKEFIIKTADLCELRGYQDWEKIKIKDYGKKLSTKNFQMTPFKVKHYAFGIGARSYSLRFKVKDKIIVFSGDTTDCKGIRQASKDADLFICDCSYPKGIRNEAHMNTTQIGEISKNSNVKTLLLTHFYPYNEKSKLQEEISEVYNGKIKRARDLETIIIQE